MSEDKFAPQTDIKAELTLTKEDLVRIKYAEEEQRLHKKQKDLNKEKAAEQKKLQKAENAFRKVLAEGTEDIPEEFARLAESLEDLGNETKGGTARSLMKVGPDQKVTLFGGDVLEGVEEDEGPTPYYVSERRMVAWRPHLKDDDRERPQYIEAYNDTILRVLTDAEQRSLDTVVEQEERVSALKKELLKVKEAISELPLMQRQAEAAIARRVLEATAAGQEMIEALGGVEVPLLEEAKEDAGAE